MCELKYEFFPWRACRAQIAAGTVARLDVRIALPSHRPSFPADRRMHLKLSTVRIGRRRRHLARPPMGRLTKSTRSTTDYDESASSMFSAGSVGFDQPAGDGGLPPGRRDDWPRAPDGSHSVRY